MNRRRSRKQRKAPCQSAPLHPYLCGCKQNNMLPEQKFDTSPNRLKTPNVIIKNTSNKRNKRAKRAIKNSRMKIASNVYLELTEKHNELQRQTEMENTLKQQMVERKHYYYLLMKEEEEKRRKEHSHDYDDFTKEISSALLHNKDIISDINDSNNLLHKSSKLSLLSIPSSHKANININLKKKKTKAKTAGITLNNKKELGATPYFKKHHFKLEPIKIQQAEQPSHLYEKHTWYGKAGQRSGNVLSNADIIAQKLHQYNNMQSSIKHHFNSNVPPSFLYYAENYSATLCQAVVRGFFGRKKAKQRKLLLKNLKNITRPFYWRREVARVYRCYSAWKWLSQYARLSVSAIIIQACVRKYLTRKQYCNIKKSLRIFRKIAMTAR